MKWPLAYLIAVCSFFLSCNNDKNSTPLTDTDVATAFIRDILDNNPDAAAQYLLADESNRQYFQIIREQYLKKDKAELQKYKNADIIINEISNVTDSISIVNYSNSYDRSLKNKLKLVRKDGKWQVDLKYTFSGNM